MEWRKILGHDCYSVSENGDIKNDKTGTIRKPQRYTKDYYSIRINGRNYLIHRIVAETFIPNPDNKPVVDHINGVRNDNRVCNLKWSTHSENLMGHGHDERVAYHSTWIRAENKKTGEILSFKSKTECAEYFKCSKSQIKTDHLYKQRNKANWIFTIIKPYKSRMI